VKRKLFSILFAFVLVLSFSLIPAIPAMAATTLYVEDDTCPAVGDGSVGNPFCSTQDAIDAASSGDTIIVNSHESVITGGVKIIADDVTLNGFKMSGSSSHIEVADASNTALNVNISYNILENTAWSDGAIDLNGGNRCAGGYTGYNTVIDAQGYYGISTIQNDDIVIEYNHVVNNSGFGAIGAGYHEGTGIIIHGNTITGSGGKGIDYWAEDGGVISENVISNCTYETITTDAQATISGNQITGGASYGIRLNSGAAGSTVSGNTISNIAYEGIQSDVLVTITNNNISGASMGIQLSTLASGSVIDGNNIHDNQYRGLSITSDVTAATVTNNHIANHLYCGVTVWGDGEGSGIHINHNSITGSKWFYGVESMRTTSDVDAENNWWGNPHGPCTPEEEKNPAGKCKGKGDAVSNNVDYEPWLNQPVVPMGHGLTP